MRESGRIRHAVVFAAALVLAGGCTTGQRGIPAAPSELTTGVGIYEHANFQGRSALITQDIGKLSDYAGGCKHESTSCVGTSCSTSTVYDWEDCVSSVKVTPGWRVTIYEDSDFHGASVELTADTPDLQLVSGPCEHHTFNDCISSIRVQPR